MSLLDEYKTEIIGVSAEVAIADYFNIAVNPDYRNRSNPKVVDLLIPLVPSLFSENNIPIPIEHIAEGLNSVDFELTNDKTLSVKSNQKKLGKVAPQVVGQPTATTYFEHFHDLINEPIPDSYEDKAKLFKTFTINNIDTVIQRYWLYLFHCDFLIYFFDVLDKNGSLGKNPQALVLSKLENPLWNKTKFTFTQTITSWNESNTVKYEGLAIGEFQVHNNRDNFKFRFNLKNILTLINSGKL